MAEGFAAINLKAIDAMIRDNVPHCRELGIRVVDLAPGTMTMALAYQERLIGNPETGFLHGGVITTLVDTVSGIVRGGCHRDLLPNTKFRQTVAYCAIA